MGTLFWSEKLNSYMTISQVLIKKKQNLPFCFVPLILTISPDPCRFRNLRRASEESIIPGLPIT